MCFLLLFLLFPCIDIKITINFLNFNNLSTKKLTQSLRSMPNWLVNKWNSTVWRPCMVLVGRQDRVEGPLPGSPGPNGHLVARTWSTPNRGPSFPHMKNERTYLKYLLLFQNPLILHQALEEERTITVPGEGGPRQRKEEMEVQDVHRFTASCSERRLSRQIWALH